MKCQNPESDFLKTFDELTGKHRTRDIWDDFVVMAACSLSNPVDKMHYEERESRYLRIIGKYSKQEQQLFPTLFALTVVALELNPEQDSWAGSTPCLAFVTKSESSCSRRTVYAR